MGTRIQKFAESMSRDLKFDKGYEIGVLEIIAMLQMLLKSFPCLNPMSSSETVEWIQSHPRLARAQGVRAISRSEGESRRHAAEIYDRGIETTSELGDAGFAELIDEAKAVV